MAELTPDQMYERYLRKHVRGVREAFDNIMRPVLVEEGIDDKTLEEIEELIYNHDKSKFSEYEWDAYVEKFYGNHKDYDHQKFDVAWNYHQKTNPHHWQYWCLINDVDEPQVMPMDIPFKYIIEMICDWQSAGNHYGNTAYDWWTRQQKKFIMTDKTKETIAKYIELFK